tara:strand:- start:1869 stop:2165 length:297 start_codon:yes stop_codon:yes gene_type:complete
MEDNKIKEKEQAVRFGFVLVGAVMAVIGVNLLFDSIYNYIGYLQLGFGIVFFGYAHNPSYFLSRLGKRPVQMARPARIITLVGFFIVFVGGIVNYLHT